MEHHKGTNPPEPVLKDTGTLECRDAVLAWDEIVEVPEKSRPDPTPRIKHPVTGKLVPDPNVRVPYFGYRGARQAPWPEVDVIVGNPPYMGDKKMREEFGDGYVDALRRVYDEVPDSADYVMCWWNRAAKAVETNPDLRAGLITTNSITQVFNRRVVERALKNGVRICWAIRNHPWIEETGGASVRVAMTVIDGRSTAATLVTVNQEGEEVRRAHAASLNSDLTADVNVADVECLDSNEGLAAVGFALHGQGFVLSSSEAMYLCNLDPAHAEIIRPFWNGRDLAQRPRGVYVIDFGLRTESAATSYPVLYNLVRTRVKPERDSNRRPSRASNWWLFGEPTPALRDALIGLPIYLATPMVAKHRFFTVMDSDIAPDQKLVVIATSDRFVGGVLSSWIHITWADAAGARIGVGDDSTYNKTRCFDPFPFPDPPRQTRERIGFIAEALDRHRKDALARDERVTMTGMYNVLQKLRSGEALTVKERDIHTIAAVGVLKDLHDELDQLVAEAYGWPWPMEREDILERLVALHDERVEEEKRGIVRWLRPEYQIPRFGKDVAATQAEAELDTEAPQPAAPESAAATAERRPWPQGAVEQIAALKALVDASPVTVTQATAAFQGARADLVRRHLETLALVGEVRADQHERYAAVSEPL